MGVTAGCNTWVSPVGVNTGCHHKVSPNASTSTDAVMDDALAGAEEVVEPKQKKGRARGTSDVFSSIFGGGSDASRLEPLNPAHRGSEKFSRRRRG